MAKTSIVRDFPGRAAPELYGEVEKVIQRLAEKYGLECVYDPSRQAIEVKEKLGVKGQCAVRDGHVAIELSHGMLGGMVAGQVKAYVEQKLDKLFT